jgi:hypothetical protein
MNIEPEAGAIFSVGELGVIDNYDGTHTFSLKGWKFCWPQFAEPICKDRSGRLTICGYSLDELREIKSRPDEFIVDIPDGYRPWIVDVPPAGG